MDDILGVRRESFCVVAKYHRFDPEIIQSVTYLGYANSARGVAPFEKPCSVLEVLNFVRRFVPNFADVTAPLVALTRKDTKPQVDSETPEEFTCRNCQLTFTLWCDSNLITLASTTGTRVRIPLS